MQNPRRRNHRVAYCRKTNTEVSANDHVVSPSISQYGTTKPSRTGHQLRKRRRLTTPTSTHWWLYKRQKRPTTSNKHSTDASALSQTSHRPAGDDDDDGGINDIAVVMPFSKWSLQKAASNPPPHIRLRPFQASRPLRLRPIRWLRFPEGTGHQVCGRTISINPSGVVMEGGIDMITAGFHFRCVLYSADIGACTAVLTSSTLRPQRSFY